MKQADIYFYGQVLMTTSLLLRDGMPPRDGYGELKARYRLIGGETGCGAAVLNSLGCSVRLDARGWDAVPAMTCLRTLRINLPT